MRPSLALVSAILLSVTSSTSGAATTFEASLADRAALPDSVRGYYGAIWVLLGHFPDGDHLRSEIGRFSVIEDRHHIDSVVHMWFRSLDTEPTEPGNTYLQELWDKVRFTDSRGFLHQNERHPAMFFDDAGDMVLVNGLPLFQYIMKSGPLECFEGLPIEIDEYHISWTGEEFLFQEDCTGRWKLIGTDLVQYSFNNPTPWHWRAAALRKSRQYAVEGLTIVDGDPAIDERSASAHAFAIVDDSTCLRPGLAVNVGVRLADFLDESVSPPRFHVQGEIAVRDFTSDDILQTIPINHELRLSSEPGANDLASLQEIIWLNDDVLTNRQTVVGVDLVNPEDHHWKRSIDILPRMTTKRTILSHSWLVTTPRPASTYLGGWVPAMGTPVLAGDSIAILCLLQSTTGHDTTTRDVYAEFSFYRIRKSDLAVELGRLYRLGEEHLDPDREIINPPEATVIKQLTVAADCHYRAVHLALPSLREGHYRIVGELRTVNPEDELIQIVVIPRVVITSSRAQQ